MGKSTLWDALKLHTMPSIARGCAIKNAFLLSRKPSNTTQGSATKAFSGNVNMTIVVCINVPVSLLICEKLSTWSNLDRGAVWNHQRVLVVGV